ncbi:hypothetical protein L6164_030710 [Bauhinia variegata]|uniref:Uncharacterized protein n=1 Tax=Bauhinia variegata TaxID=167791 RepID=A0ACB9LCR7_BAUVA|nr:hypothetical protein L6164_030710 [Bauhinia variegata]
MDLKSECSALESVEENEVKQEKSSRGDENGTRNNGSIANESYELGCQGNSNPNLITADEKGNVEAVSEEPVRLSGGSPLKTKGYGLRKWRRIRRDNIVKDPHTPLDSNKILKRGLALPVNSSKSQPSPFDVKQNSEGSIGSSNMLKNVGFTDGFAIRGSSSDSRYAAGSGFAAGTDSENSEEQSSKSSTAASAPKLRFDLPAVLGNVRDKSQSKNTSSKNSANSNQKVQQGKGRIESSKKPRGERVKMEKENSHSSMESDSRSSNFKHGVFTVTSNGKHNGSPIIYDGGDSNEAHTNDHFLEEAQASYCKDNMGEEEDILQEDSAANLSWDAKEEKSENNQPSTVGDPLFESVCSLQSVQEALEEELQKLREIGNEPLSPDDDSIKSSSPAADITAVDPEFHKSSLYGQSDVEGIKQTASRSLELQVLSLTQSVNILESKLEESQGMLALKNSKIAELEATLRSGRFPKEESGSTVGLEEEQYMETELESFFRQKIEAEVEYLAIMKMMENLKVATDFQLTLLEEQETLSGKQAQALNMLGETENKASALKNQAEELEKHCDHILEVEETLKMQKRVYKVTFYFFIQFMLLIFVFWFVVSQLSLNAGVVVPT